MGWLSKYEDGGKKKFLEPNDKKLPKGRLVPFQPEANNSELASSIGGEQGEDAYLIPTFKYGQPLNSPLKEYRETGEHLGGPFKTWQEADEWDKEIRHPYVAKGQSLPSPLKRWGKDYENGGFLGTTNRGFNKNGSWNGAWENGGEMSYYQQGRDFQPKMISENGSIITKAQDGYISEEEITKWARENNIKSTYVKDKPLTREELYGKQEYDRITPIEAQLPLPRQAVPIDITPYSAIQAKPFDVIDNTIAPLPVDNIKPISEDASIPAEIEKIDSPVVRERRETIDRMKSLSPDIIKLKEIATKIARIKNREIDNNELDRLNKLDNKGIDVGSSESVPPTKVKTRDVFNDLIDRLDPKEVHSIDNTGNIILKPDKVQQREIDDHISTLVKINTPLLSDNKQKLDLHIDKIKNANDVLTSAKYKKYPEKQRAIVHDPLMDETPEDVLNLQANLKNDPKTKTMPGRYFVYSKKDSTFYVFDKDHKMISGIKALRGIDKGDTLNIGDPTPSKASQKGKLTTPAGVYDFEPLNAQEYLNDYGTPFFEFYSDKYGSLGVHGVYKDELGERNTILYNPDIAEKLYSYGCINVPKEWLMLKGNTPRMGDDMYVTREVDQPISQVRTIPSKGVDIRSVPSYGNELAVRKSGGVVKDNLGYWNPENWGKPVEIDSPYITMQGVDRELIGVSDEGDTKLLKPGKDYKFKGKKVREYPIAKYGIQEVHQLQDFTNRPSKWLSKYE